nr:cupin domain-containing protein [Halosimplex aquaticum]
MRALDDLDGEPHANAFPDAEPKTIRLTLAAGEAVPAHDHPDREIVLYLVEGEIELTLGEETHEVTAGDVARFDGDQDVSPKATEDSTALLVLAERAGD